jgi:hypothetical protein
MDKFPFLAEKMAAHRAKVQPKRRIGQLTVLMA